MKVVKESSDELNPSVVVTDAYIERAPRQRTLGDDVARAVATCGVGYFPVAPGTWGSLVGVSIYLLVGVAGAQAVAANAASASAVGAFLTTFMLALIIAVSLAGTWAATRVESFLQVKDPGIVVVDEVAGQLIAFLFVPWDAGWWAVAAGFAAFRLFDIWKPYPIDRLEALESGLGVMADDVLAGAYAATLMALLSSIVMML
jgi:phosphatidylglycerophosphatase A